MGHREPCVLRMIERGSRPRSRVVAVLARRWEKLRLGFVARIRAVVVVSLVAADALRGQRTVVVVNVTIGASAGWHRVRAGKWKCRVVVVETRVPVSRGVAEFACCREACSCVCRVVGAVVVLLMARIAQGVIQRVVVVDMAVRTETWRHRVSARQLEAGGVVVEGPIAPVNGVMTSFAGRREGGRNVVHGRLRRVVVGLVAGDTGSAGQVVVVVDVAIGTGAWRNRM